MKNKKLLEHTEFGVIPMSQIKGSDADLDRNGKASVEHFKKHSAEDDRLAQFLSRKRRSTWNSVNFENEDFLNGFAAI